MTKLWMLLLTAGLSSCVTISNPPIDPAPTPAPAEITSLSVATSYQSTGNANEYYLCGNRDSSLETTIAYSGAFTSYKVVLVGENNPSVQLVKGPFAFDAENGDSRTRITRTVVIAVGDAKPTSGAVTAQGVTVTPAPPQVGGDLGLGAFRVRIDMVTSAGVVSKTSSAIVRVLGNSNSRCSVPPPSPPVISTVSVAARFVSNASVNEYYICGNQNEQIAVNIAYSGSFNSYNVVLVGELNPTTPLVKGPYTFDSGNGDTATAITREITVSTTDIKPTAVNATPQAVIVTPTPPQSGSNLGLGAFRVRVEMTSAGSTVSSTSSATVRVLGNNNSLCAAPAPAPVIDSVTLASRFQDNATGDYYLCGNLSETVDVSFTYSGSFSSYRLVFYGELNPSTELVKGPFAFDASNGDTSSAITRSVVISNNDIHPLSGTVRPQAVIVTPIPTPPSNTLVALGSMKVRVELIGSNGTVQRNALGRIRLLTNTSPRC